MHNITPELPQVNINVLTGESLPALLHAVKVVIMCWQ
jgi:hypothetical protein